MNHREIGSILLFAGVTQFILLFKIAEFLYPKYSVAYNYISDLGVGPVAYIFNSSIIVLGLLGLVAGYLLFKWDKIFSTLLILASLGSAGVGFFPENMGILHSISALITFLFSGLNAIYSYRVDTRMSKYFWPVLGVISLVSLLLFISHNYLLLRKSYNLTLTTDYKLTWQVEGDLKILYF